MHSTVAVIFKVVCVIFIVCQFAKAQDSREGDSLALVAILDANGGIGWNTEEPINNWSGVTAEGGATDRVTSIYLGNKNLGTLPPEIGNLTKMMGFILNNNNVSAIPTEIGNCTELTELIFDNNFLTTVPAEIGDLNKLTYLSLLKNIIDSLPAEIGDLSSLQEFYLENNNLTSIPTEMGNLSNLTIISLDKNQLHFDDIELMKGFVDECYYSPQDTLGTATVDTIDSLSPELKIGVAVRGIVNHYAWTRDGNPVGGDTDSITITENGVYVCNITSDSITDLTLTHKPITITMPTPIIVENNRIPQSDFLIIPNPHYHITTICYQLPGFSQVKLTIYNITGQKVSTLVSERQPSGNYRYEWDAGDMAGGAYFCQLTTGDFVQVKKLIILE